MVKENISNIGIMLTKRVVKLEPQNIARLSGEL